MLELTENTIKELFRLAQENAEEEVCGFIWRQGYFPFTVVHPLKNIHREPDKFYEVGTKDLREAYRAMDKAHGLPVGFYHSHPGGKPEPSEVDMQGAMNPGLHYVIIYRDGLLGWWLSAWYCTEPGILLSSEWKVTT